MEGRSSLKLIIADNGIIKEIKDHNVNGTGTDDEYTVLYEFKESPKEKTIELLYDLTEDLGLNLGSKFEEQVITIGMDIGKSYAPTEEYIDFKIKDLKKDLAYYKTLKKEFETE